MIIGLLNSPFHLEAALLKHIYLTWQADPCRNVTITVHGSKTPDTLFLYYDTKACHSKISDYAFKQKIIGKPFQADGRSIYHFQLQDLKPDTLYFFTVGDSHHAYETEKKFRTLPEEGPLFFVEGGDWENTPAAELLAKRAASLNPHALLLGGDYPTNVRTSRDFSKWDTWLAAYEKNLITGEGCLIPFVMAIGNHEVYKGRAPFYFRFFPQGSEKKSYFSLSVGPRVRLFVLDSGHLEPHEGQQQAWLSKELKEHADIPVKIALYHVPIFPSVRFAKQDNFFRFLFCLVEKCKNKKMAENLFSLESSKGREYWMPLFDEYCLTVAFEHHDQALKRTKLLRNERADSKGTLYLGDGGFGPKLQYPPIQGLFYSYFASLKGNVHFFWTMKIEEKKITYQAVSERGKILDRFVQRLD